MRELRWAIILFGRNKLSWVKDAKEQGQIESIFTTQIVFEMTKVILQAKNLVLYKYVESWTERKALTTTISKTNKLTQTHISTKEMKMLYQELSNSHGDHSAYDSYALISSDLFWPFVQQHDPYSIAFLASAFSPRASMLPVKQINIRP